MPKLSEIKVGQRVRVLSVEGSPQVKQRVKEMGITPGVELQVVRVAPLGDPVDVVVRDHHLSLRRSEGESIVVEVLA